MLGGRQVGSVSGVVSEIVFVPVRRTPSWVIIRALGLKRQSGAINPFRALNRAVTGKERFYTISSRRAALDCPRVGLHGSGEHSQLALRVPRCARRQCRSIWARSRCR